ncbi:MAG: hypothetical protein DRI75_00270 [Bacteroidetes bacterium]|nr:MAG: hypothetical protein DRI75_00270 [Bacteroidota bacterium]
MGNGIKMLLVLALMFSGIYLFSISHRYIKAAKRNKIRKAKLIREDEFRKKKIRLQKNREEKAWFIELRRKEIKRQFKWLEGMNQKIKSKTRVE